MGTWGTGAFENDNALDWIGEFCEDPGDAGLRAALLAAADADGLLEAPEAESALAAAEIVAALKGAPTTDAVVVEDYLPIITRASIPVGAELSALALRAIDRVVSDSELKELWDELEDATAWYDEVATLRQRVVHPR
ncbi:MAG: DUF4259 domain-containing protein [Candidatus Eremiobacteraeota bacterium]|nr:DUF4259 domain-containing protein [Candidatus Eremiobacteraeota bacterium]